MRQLPLNIPKYIVLYLGRGYINFSYYINGIQLPSEDMVSDLGITISRDLPCHEHINKILVKCLERLFIIKESYNYKNPDINKLLFTAYMRQILEYVSLLWNPHSQHKIDMIEHIQSHFLIYNITNLSVSGPPTFELRRLCQMLRLYYSILINSCCLKPNKFFVINNWQNLRGH